jgi:hypothetical protein
MGGSLMENDFTSSDRGQSNELRCSRCRSPLTFHQPDTQLPDRLLATCDRCKSWFLSDSSKADLIPIDLPEDVSRRP